MVNNDVIWSDLTDTWNSTGAYWYLVEITAVSTGGGFSSRRYKYDTKPQSATTQTITIVCIVNGETFEESKYINKKISIDTYDEDFVITEIKKISVSVDKIIFKEVLSNTKDEIRVEISDVKIINNNNYDKQIIPSIYI